MGEIQRRSDIEEALAPIGAATPDLERLQQVGAWDGSGQPAAPEDEAEYGVVTYFGEKIRVALDPLSLELSFEEFMDLASSLEGPEDPRSFAAVRTFLRTIVHPDDFTKFWRLVKTNRQDVVAQMGFGKWLVEEITGHPTEQRSGSAAGPLRTPPSSGDDVSSRVQRRLEEQGRPDLALVVLNRRETAASSGG